MLINLHDAVFIPVTKKNNKHRFGHKSKHPRFPKKKRQHQSHKHKQPRPPQPKPFDFSDEGLRERLVAAAKKVGAEDTRSAFIRGCVSSIVSRLALDPKSVDILTHFFAGTPNNDAIVANLAQLKPYTREQVLNAYATLLRSHHTLDGTLELSQLAVAASWHRQATLDLLNIAKGPTRIPLALRFTQAYAELTHAFPKFTGTLARTSFSKLSAAVDFLLRDDVYAAVQEVQPTPGLHTLLDTLSAVASNASQDASLAAASVLAVHNAYASQPQAHQTSMSALATAATTYKDARVLANLSNVLVQPAILDTAHRALTNHYFAHVHKQVLAITDNLLFTADPAIAARVATFALTNKDHVDAAAAVDSLYTIAAETQDELAVQHVLDIARQHINNGGARKITRAILTSATPQDDTIPLNAYTIRDACQTYSKSA